MASVCCIGQCKATLPFLISEAKGICFHIFFHACMTSSRIAQELLLAKAKRPFILTHWSLQKLSSYNIVFSRSFPPVFFAFSYSSAQHMKMLVFSEVYPWHRFFPLVKVLPIKKYQPFPSLQLLPPDK